jgi:hypothetical protein
MAGRGDYRRCSAAHARNAVNPLWILAAAGVAGRLGLLWCRSKARSQERERYEMIDFSAATEIVARRPLVLLLGVLVLGGAVTHFLFKKYPIGRAVIRVIFLILLTIALLYRDIVPYRPLELTGRPFLDAVHVALKIAWWLYAAWFLVGVLRAVLVFHGSPRETKLLQDLFAGPYLSGRRFCYCRLVFNLPVQGLLATSGAVAIILGLALQSTLGDVFSGVVLSFTRPYRPGDWISLEGATDGRVIEMNWRATYVLTGRRDLAIVPNSIIAKSKIVNVSSPSGIHGTTVAVQLDAKTPPAICTEILEHRNTSSDHHYQDRQCELHRIRGHSFCRRAGLDDQGPEQIFRRDLPASRSSRCRFRAT